MADERALPRVMAPLVQAPRHLQKVHRSLRLRRFGEDESVESWVVGLPECFLISDIRSRQMEWRAAIVGSLVRGISIEYDPSARFASSEDRLGGNADTNGSQSGCSN